jgi:ABC-type sugar transport system ATPase subunit
LVDEPTRGIDVAARAAVHRILRSWADSGKGVVVVSSDLEELLEISDRIGVLSNGRWVQTFEGPDFDRALLLQAMFSGYAAAVPSELRRST